MIYMFLANGFEEVEALTPLDLLRRAGADIKTVGIGSRSVEGAHGIAVMADLLDSEIEDLSAEMIILPGGMPGTLGLAESEIVKKALDIAVNNGSYIAAICAAPSVLGKYGILHGKTATCFPGFEDSMIGANCSTSGVCRDGKIITAAGMGVALEFGLALVEALYGKEKSDELFISTQAHRR